MWRLRLVLPALLLGALAPAVVHGGEAPLPKARELESLVEAYLDADFAERQRMRKAWDAELAPLEAKDVPKLRKVLLKIALDHGPTLGKKGSQWFFEKGRGKYIVSGRPSKALFLGLHGGGAGAGSAESAAGAMGGGGWMWIYPEVLEKTERGWTDAGTEAFVVDLIQAAKRTFKLDPNRIFLSGHSMGGYGSWTIGAHHADMFAGIAPYAGAPSCVTMLGQEKPSLVEPGVLPNLYNVPLHVYQSGDDLNVPPVSNDLATELLRGWKERHPGGFTYRYDRVEGRGHAAPQEGYLPSQKWLASHDRVPRPRKFLWQPVLSWKRQFYWAYWAYPEMESVLQVEAHEGNQVELTSLEGGGDLGGLSILLGAPLVDLDKPVTIMAAGKRVFEGVVPLTFSTLMLTLPRLDEDLLFDARVDI